MYRTLCNEQYLRFTLYMQQLDLSRPKLESSALPAFTVFVTADNDTSSVIPLPVNEANSSDITIGNTTNTDILSLSDNSKYKVAKDSADSDHTGIVNTMSDDCKGTIKAGEIKRCVISNK